MISLLCKNNVAYLDKNIILLRLIWSCWICMVYLLLWFDRILPASNEARNSWTPSLIVLSSSLVAGKASCFYIPGSWSSMPLLSLIKIFASWYLWSLFLRVWRFTGAPPWSISFAFELIWCSISANAFTGEVAYMDSLFYLFELHIPYSRNCFAFGKIKLFNTIIVFTSIYTLIINFDRYIHY